MNEVRALPTRRRVNSDPNPALSEALTVTRFWRNVDVQGYDDCWPWLGDSRDGGYGVFFYHGRIWGSHELALSFSTGEIRHPSLDTCHECDNPSCCNPAHLRFDTRLSNVRDMDQRGRRKSTAKKLTPADVETIRVRRANGARQKDLADQYGVTDGLISSIVRGLRWADAGGPLQTERKHTHGE